VPYCRQLILFLPVKRHSIDRRSNDKNIFFFKILIG
jgi:hypothetical protein